MNASSPACSATQSGRNETEHVLANRRLVAALGGNVHELERPRGEAVGERGHRRSVPRHNHAVTARQPDPAPGAEPERGFLLGVYPKRADTHDELGELGELARTAGVLPVGELVQHRAHPDPRSFVGKGKLAELKQVYGDASAEALLVDDELSPTQQRTLEDALKTRVVDRTQLILDIFAQHARSSEGKLQVELAQLEYNLPRMRGMWQHLERLGGGVGTRGPGESQLETDRRLARTRVSLLKKRLRTLGSQRSTRRKERMRTSAPTIALAGYTNVGKSTLLNALTGAQAVGGRSAVRDTRSDDTWIRARRQALPRDRHGGLHQAAADAARGGLRRDARGDARGRSHPARRRRVASRGASGRDDRRGRRACWPRSAPTTSPWSSC